MGKETINKKNQNLFSEFLSTEPEEWKKQIEEDLRGADYKKKLVWHTREGFNVQPFYTEKDLEDLTYLTDSMPGQFPFVRGNSQTRSKWSICEEISSKNTKESNKDATYALSNGADSLTFNALPGELKVLLKDLPLGENKINFIVDFEALEIPYSLITEAEKRGINTSTLAGAFYLEPLNELFSNGALPCDYDECFLRLKGFIDETGSKTPNYKVLSINSENFSNAGSGIVQELAFTMAMGSEYLVQLGATGLSPDQVSKKMVFRFPVSSDYFMEIAKLRAARILWAKIVDKFNPKDPASREMTVHCRTSGQEQSEYDPYKKMLSDTIESMAAVIGGCDSLTVTPFDIKDEAERDYSERLTRNTQLVLREEAYLNKIIDPGSGSYYIEKLTGFIATEALKLFKIVEENGGFIKCVENSFIQDKIDKVK